MALVFSKLGFLEIPSLRAKYIIFNVKSMITVMI